MKKDFLKTLDEGLVEEKKEVKPVEKKIYNGTEKLKKMLKNLKDNGDKDE